MTSIAVKNSQQATNSTLSTKELAQDPEELLLNSINENEETSESQTNPDSISQSTKPPVFIGPPVFVGSAENTKPFWNPKAIIDRVVQAIQNGTFIGDGRSFQLLFNALTAVTGEKPTEEKMIAIRKFVSIIKEGNGDVNRDGAVNGNDMIEVWKKGTCDIPKPPKPIDKGLALYELTILIDKAKQGERLHNSPEFLLEAYTGIKATPEKIKAMNKFLDDLVKNKTNDVNHDGHTDVNDLIQVWKTENRRYPPPPTPENKNEEAINS